jgi:hypothetical protein
MTMKALSLAALLCLAAAPASATNIVTFSQSAATNTLTATVNGADTQTTLTVTDAAVTIGSLVSGPPPATVFFDLSVASIDAVTTLAGAAIQHYDGSFCLSSGPGCSGVDVLSGNFADAAFGALGGPGLVVNVNDPPDTLSLASSLIPAADLTPPNAFSLGFTNLDPALAVLGSTLAPFSASFAGTVSASAVNEPATLGLLGLALLGLGAARAKRRAMRG